MNIVSIDFDIIMKPSIEYYNNVMNKEEAFASPLMQVCTADLTIYTKLTKWLIEMTKEMNADDIIFIESHEAIINYIPKDPKVRLINIDHHHDVGYHPTDVDVDLGKNLHCGNWGKYLLKHNLIDDYIWICNENSQKNYMYSSIKTHYISEYNLNSLKADKIIICLSNHWVPPQFRTLFYNWMDILSVLKNTIYFLN